MPRPGRIDDGPDDNYSTWEDNDLHLLPNSPCIEAGDPIFDPEPGETDIDGDPRVLSIWVDMGTDEYTYDCNENSEPDWFDIASGTSEDCNENGIPDSCEIGARPLQEFPPKSEQSFRWGTPKSA